MPWCKPNCNPLSYSCDPIFSDYEFMLRKGRCFRIEKLLLLNSGNTVTFVSLTPSDKTECHFRVKIDSTGETEYRVFVEPTVTSYGTKLTASGKNPHIQFLGGYKSKFDFWYQPTVSSSGTTVREKHWSSGSKDAGSYEQVDRTILSPNQTLLYYLKSFTNTNYVNIEYHWFEQDDGYAEK